MKLKYSLSCVICCLLAANTYAGSVVSDVPPKADSSGKFIFYLHGSVEESEGSTEKYEAAVQAIADSDATVISEVRDDTDPNEYSGKLKAKVDQLIAGGVPPGNITISGFSKGAIITLAAAGIINNPKVNYVLLAGCSGFLNKKYRVDPAKAVGRMLSIYDSEDTKFGTCEGMINAGDKLEFKEIGLDSGKGHKVFRIPKDKFIEQWRDPLVDWADA